MDNRASVKTTSSFQSQWAESVNSYYFRVELPGFSHEDIEIDLKSGELHILAIKGVGSKDSTIQSVEDQGSDELKAEEFLKAEETEDGLKPSSIIPIKRPSYLEKPPQFKTSFKIPADKAKLSGIHGFMDGDCLVVKIPKLKPEDLPSFKIKVLEPKL